jgi:hypothetical protein
LPDQSARPSRTKCHGGPVFELGGVGDEVFLLITALEFRATRSNDPLLAALKLLRDLHQSGQREIPSDAPMPFRKAWRKLMLEQGRPARRLYETAVGDAARQAARGRCLGRALGQLSPLRQLPVATSGSADHGRRARLAGDGGSMAGIPQTGTGQTAEALCRQCATWRARRCRDA